MPDRTVAYLERTDRGAEPVRVRLEGAGAGVFDIPRSDGGAEAVLDGIAEAAAWIRERLPTKKLSLLVVDVDGAACAWLTDAEPTDESIRALVLDHAESPAGDEEDGGTDEGVGVAGHLPEMTDESDYTPLGVHGAAEPRVSAIGMPALAARLLLDELDRVGVRLAGVTDLWHAMARTWGKSRSSGGGIDGVDSGARLTAVLTPAGQDTLVWCWASDGQVIAAGRQRLAAPDGDGPIDLTTDDLARLSADWMGWASQLGQSPERIVCPVSELAGDAMGPRSERSLARNELLGALGRAWPEATAEVIDEPDPIGAMLTKLVESADGPAPSPGLARRPGRLTRASYRWAGAAVLIASIGVGIAGYGLLQAADRRNEQAVAFTTATRELVGEVDSEIAASPFWQTELRELRDDLQPKSVPTRFDRPVLDAFTDIVYLVGNPETIVNTLDLNAQGLVRVIVETEDLELIEFYTEQFDSFAGTYLEWQRTEARRVGERYRGSFLGEWLDTPRNPSGEGNQT